MLALATTGNVSTFEIPSPFALGAIPASLVTYCNDLAIENADYPIYANMRAQVDAQQLDRYGVLNTIGAAGDDRALADDDSFSLPGAPSGRCAELSANRRPAPIGLSGAASKA